VSCFGNGYRRPLHIDALNILYDSCDRRALTVVRSQLLGFISLRKADGIHLSVFQVRGQNWSRLRCKVVQALNFYPKWVLIMSRGT
jgi:hypothetical protein